MRVSFKCILSLLFFALVNISWADSKVMPWFSKGENNQIKLRVDLFLSSTCPHCQKADAFFRSIEPGKPWLEVHRYLINKDKAALMNFHQDLEQQNIDDYAVPAIFFCNSRWIGFDEATSTGVSLLRALNYCHQQVTKTGQLTPQTTQLLKQWANASFFGASMVSKPSVAIYIPLMALTDAFSPCAIFAVLALFSFLWLSRRDARQLSLGIVFIIVLGFVHYLQQDHTIFFYQALLWLRIPAILIGLGLFAYIYTEYKNIEPKNFARPLLVALTALAVEAYQQNCTPNFALIFEQWVNSQAFSPALRGIYLVLYNLIYLLPLVLIMIGFIYLCKSWRLNEIADGLTSSAWCILLIIGILLIIYPVALSSFMLSGVVLILSLLLGFIMTRAKYSKI